ncbi:MAG: type II toxin-antitoxin system RelE/ParE family toxin [Planctomycetia bacterium]|nr:type II toxin-antitoxin system RelE/ParE family toxin [Planctomycetia bacterium]
MKYRVIIQPRALADLEAGFEYVALQNQPAAARWLSRFLSAIDGLADLPERCSIARESELVGKEIRQLLFGRRPGVWRALFVIESDAVRVLCLRHSARQDVSAEDLPEGL